MAERPVLVRNAADPEQVRKAKQTEAERGRSEDDDLRNIMSAPVGRRFVWRLLGEFGIYRSIYDGHGGRMSFNAGKHDTGLWLMAQIQRVAPHEYLVMQAEAAHLDAVREDPKPAKESDA